jgi:putative IMPACT (imprinted ancient) family translation regulator
MGMSDDGEPKGTAGRPVLQVLKGSGLTNILCAVIRYFGGTKLGTGGLVKAYTETAQAALENLPSKRLVSEINIRIEISYECYDSARRIVTLTDGSRITGEEFLTEVAMNAVIPVEALALLTEELNNVTSGKAAISITDSAALD